MKLSNKYRKKPVVIEAIQFFIKNKKLITDFLKAPNTKYWFDAEDNVNYMYVDTLKGKIKATEGDWIIKGVQGEFYPCKPNIFEQTYEKEFNI